MENFEFLSPTKIIFGKGTEDRAGEEAKKYCKKILLLYGGGSIKKTGLYDRVVKSLRDSGVEFIELSGVLPNPRLSLVQQGIKLCRDNGIGFILAVGGGSVIDTAKSISVGIPYHGNVWDFHTAKAVPVESVPIGVVLTIAAAGSETSKSAVITNEEGWYKRGMKSDLVRPRFSILNPELGFTLPPYQTACGIADIMAHIMERYFTNVTDVEFTDRLCEASLKTVINNAWTVMEKPDDYNARAEIMLTGAFAHNDLLSMGRVGDFASHMIEHELSGIYDIAHGAGLSIVFPAWMKYVVKKNIDKILQFAERVFDIKPEYNDPEKAAFEGIKRLEAVFTKIGLPVRLSEINIGNDRFEEMADKCKKIDGVTTGYYVKLDRSDIINILKLAE